MNDIEQDNKLRKAMKNKNKPLPDPVGWTPEGEYITGGLRWGIDSFGRTCCNGPEETPPNHDDSPQDVEKPVSKLMQVESVGVDDSQTQNGGSYETTKIKHPGGRPRKTEDISRVTDWRRRKEKELQGVLAL